MIAPAHFEVAEHHAIFRPTGEVTLDQAVEMVTSAIAFAREQKIGKLLVDTTGFTGFAPPDLAARYFFVREWARAAGGDVRIAVVARRIMIDPDRFEVAVATNSGLAGDVFESEQEAIAWLQSSKQVSHAQKAI